MRPEDFMDEEDLDHFRSRQVTARDNLSAKRPHEVDTIAGAGHTDRPGLFHLPRYVVSPGEETLGEALVRRLAATSLKGGKERLKAMPAATAVPRIKDDRFGLGYVPKERAAGLQEMRDRDRDGGRSSSKRSTLLHSLGEDLDVDVEDEYDDGKGILVRNREDVGKAVRSAKDEIAAEERPVFLPATQAQPQVPVFPLPEPAPGWVRGAVPAAILKEVQPIEITRDQAAQKAAVHLEMMMLAELQSKAEKYQQQFPSAPQREVAQLGSR
jgi:hypothetical protein